MSNSKYLGTVLVFLGAVFWSLNAPLVKFLSADSLLICGFRSLIAGITLLPFLHIRRLKWTPWMILYLTAYCALCISIIVSLSKTSATIAIGMQYTSTIWLFISNLLITKKFRITEFIPVCIISIGVIFFMCSGKEQSNITGNLIALSEGLFFALMSIGSQKSAGDNPLGLTALANLFTGVFIFTVFPTTIGKINLLSKMDWIVLFILGVVQIGGGYGFYNIGLQYVSAQKASIIALWEMILGPIWVALFLKEYPNPAVLIGFFIIIIGIFLDATLNSPIYKRKKH